MSWIAAGIGAGVGALKSDQEQKNYTNQMKLAAETQRWSPWSGIKAQMPNKMPDAMGDVLAGGAAGAALGQGIKNSGRVPSAGASDPGALADMSYQNQFQATPQTPWNYGSRLGQP